MTLKPKLELTWIGKENRPRLELRILIEDPEKSYHAKYRVKDLAAKNPEIAKKNDGELENSDSMSTLRSMRPSSSSGDLFEHKLIFGDTILLGKTA